MTRTPKDDDEILASLDSSLAEDALREEFSDDDVAAALRTADGDPTAIGKRGAALAAELLERRRLAWQEQARRKIDRARPLFEPVADYSRMDKPELVELYHRARANPRLSRPISELFHKRKAEGISVEELRKLLVEVDTLARLDEIGDDDPEEK